MSENKSTKTQTAAINTAAPAKAKAPAKTANKKAAAQFVSTPLDRLLWLCAIVLVGGAIFGNFYYTQHIVIDESSLGRFGRTAIVIAVIIAGLAAFRSYRYRYRCNYCRSCSYSVYQQRSCFIDFCP